MDAERNKVLARHSTPTTKSYRAAIAKIIRQIQGEMHDGELAERLGCSVGTIRNARNEKGNLDGVTLSRIQHEFGPDALDPFQKLGNARGVPIEARCDTDALPTTAAAVHKLAIARCPTSPGGSELTHTELLDMKGEIKAAQAALSNLQMMIDTLEAAA